MKTLLIVGAGASKEAGLPTGAELKADIASRLNLEFEDRRQTSGDAEIVQALFRHTQAEDGSKKIEPYVEAAIQIHDAMPLAPSIDTFIDNHRGNERIETCGKLAIVRSILEAERNSEIFIAPQSRKPKIDFKKIEKTWFGMFWKLLTDGARRDTIASRIKSVSFINFNYDRCIEHFLYHALRDYFGISDSETADLINEVEIVHPYGTVGYLPWQSGNSVVPFGDQKTGADLLSRSTEIKTFTERVEDRVTVDLMRQLVQTAKRVVFLGFAFHSQNLELIKPDEPTQVKRVYLTRKGISQSDYQDVEPRIYKFFGNVNINLYSEHEMTCSKLFGEYWRRLAFSQFASDD